MLKRGLWALGVVTLCWRLPRLLHSESLPYLLVGGGIAVIALTALRRSETSWRRLNAVSDWLALQHFSMTYPAADLHGAVVVIPALNEADTLGRVLAEVPKTAHGYPVHTLVINDGSNDGTPVVAHQGGAYVCSVPFCRGQGAALRLGYQLAVRHGAQFVVTLDADGQYRPTEMAGLLDPIVRGQADFVQGSRRLGRYEPDSRLRLAGVYVFGWLFRVLTRQHVTDTSNGFRAIRTDVLRRVTLREDQYHASELLMQTLFQGYKVVERPVTMLRRQGGKTKKGRSLAYGYHYTRVIISTWLRGG